MPVLAAVLACGGAGAAASRAASPPPETVSGGEVLRGAELARLRCLLVAPFENGSDAPVAGETATAAIVSGVERAGARVYPIKELRAMFHDTPLELPAGFGPSLAHELAVLVGADAVVSGSVVGRSRDASPELLVSFRVSLAADHELLFAREALVRPAPGERVEIAFRREVLAAARPMLDKLGGDTSKRCFDPDRARVLRELALRSASGTATPTSAARAPSTPAQAAASTRKAPPPTPAPPPLTARQAEWARRLAAGDRLMVEDLAFAGRTADVSREGGLGDLAAAAATVPTGALRLEGFVDATTDRAGDAKLSLAMADAVAQRLVALGVPRAKIATAGRGGESPLLPNFTLRGRATNRRVEAVVVR